MYRSILLVYVFFVAAFAWADEPPRTTTNSAVSHNSALQAGKSNIAQPEKPIVPSFGLDVSGVRYFGNSPELKKELTDKLTLDQKKRLVTYTGQTYSERFNAQSTDNELKAFHLLTGLGGENAARGQYEWSSQDLIKWLMRKVKGVTVRELIAITDSYKTDTVAIQIYDEQGKLVFQSKFEEIAIPSNYRLKAAIEQADQEKYNEIFNGLEYQRKKAEEEKLKADFAEAWKKF